MPIHGLDDKGRFSEIAKDTSLRLFARQFEFEDVERAAARTQAATKTRASRTGGCNPPPAPNRKRKIIDWSTSTKKDS